MTDLVQVGPITEEFATVSLNLTKLIHRSGERPKNFTQTVYKRQVNPGMVDAILKAIDAAVRAAQSETDV